jgi:hypothetical protein
MGEDCGGKGCVAQPRELKMDYQGAGGRRPWRSVARELLSAA